MRAAAAFETLEPSASGEALVGRVCGGVPNASPFRDRAIAGAVREAPQAMGELEMCLQDGAVGGARLPRPRRSIC
jgi:hypothetical protein